MKNSLALLLLAVVSLNTFAQQTQKPPLHGKNWMAITGKPRAAEAGAMIFGKGGNAIDAACAMLQQPGATTRTIAASLGFSDEFHFSRRFKQITGMSPREFRRLLPRGR